VPHRGLCLGGCRPLDLKLLSFRFRIALTPGLTFTRDLFRRSTSIEHISQDATLRAGCPENRLISGHALYLLAGKYSTVSLDGRIYLDMRHYGEELVDDGCCRPDVCLEPVLMKAFASWRKVPSAAALLSRHSKASPVLALMELASNHTKPSSP
jgi:hypothetical protein